MLKNCSTLRETIFPNNKNCSHYCSSCDDYDRRNDTGVQPDLQGFKCILSELCANMTELSCFNNELLKNRENKFVSLTPGGGAVGSETLRKLRICLNSPRPGLAEEKELVGFPNKTNTATNMNKYEWFNFFVQRTAIVVYFLMK